jgi:hypothetical protein
MVHFPIGFCFRYDVVFHFGLLFSLDCILRVCESETSGLITHRDYLIQFTTGFPRVLPDGKHDPW